MSDASNYAENEIADWLGANGAPGTVSNVYVKLHTGAPGEAGTANAATETSREEATFGAASGGVVTMSNTPTWSSVAATETYSHISLWDAATSGNCLGTTSLSSSVSVTSGDDFELTSLTITVA